MQQLIASYFFQHKTCPIPGFGTLSLTNSKAVSDVTNKTISAPMPVIHFDNNETNINQLLKYIAVKTNSDNYEAAEALDHFCDGLQKDIAAKSSAKISGIGSFVVYESGKINFNPEELSTVYLPTVTAKRVIHPDAEHQILVGDKETTNTVMTDYFNETLIEKDRWWIWALVLAATGLAAILFYQSNPENSSLFGNLIKI